MHTVLAIAKKDITSNTWSKIESTLSYMKENDMNYKQFYELACWADDLKGAAMTALDGWHFYNQPFCDGIDPEKVTVVVDKDYCVVDSVDSTRSLLGWTSEDSKFYKSWMLRYFLHTVGDMHQPLHVTTRATPQHPEGDKGGNSFKLNYRPDNLHALWDEVMGMIPPVKRPLDQAGVDAIEMWANNIKTQYTREKLSQDLRTKDPWTIAKQLYKVAVDEAYKDIKENTAPSQDYLKTRFETCKKLLALAGYRLADYLNESLK